MEVDSYIHTKGQGSTRVLFAICVPQFVGRRLQRALLSKLTPWLMKVDQIAVWELRNWHYQILKHVSVMIHALPHRAPCPPFGQSCRRAVPDTLSQLPHWPRGRSGNSKPSESNGKCLQHPIREQPASEKHSQPLLRNLTVPACTRCSVPMQWHLRRMVLSTARSRD